MQLMLSPEDIRPLIEQAVATILDQFGDPQRVSYPEPEAAKLCGIEKHVLRDARLRQELPASKIGRGFSYTRADLVKWIESRRVKTTTPCPL